MAERQELLLGEIAIGELTAEEHPGERRDGERVLTRAPSSQLKFRYFGPM